MEKLKQFADKALTKKNYENAKNMIEKGLRMHAHDDPTLHFQCGIANFNLGYLLQAEQLFQKAIALH